MLLEKTLVVRDTVLPEHKSIVTVRNHQPCCLPNCIIPAHRSSGKDCRKPIHQHSGLCGEGRIIGNARRNVPGHARNGAIHLAGCKRRNWGSGGAKVNEGRRNAEQTQVDVVECGSEGSRNLVVRVWSRAGLAPSQAKQSDSSPVRSSGHLINQACMPTQRL